MVQSFPLTQVKFCESELNISSKRLSLLYTYRGITAFFSNHFFCKLSEFKFWCFSASLNATNYQRYVLVFTSVTLGKILQRSGDISSVVCACTWTMASTA